MIIYPKNWSRVGQQISLKDIQSVMYQILKEFDCRNLALSGGVDSTTMLAMMTDVFGAKVVKCYNIALSEKHPDYIFSDMAAKYFGVDLVHRIPCKKLQKIENDFPGDEIVREFYQWLFEERVESIIACDGVDEFMGGYYDHIKNPTEETYYNYIRRLQKEQLIPLDNNSGKVKVILPYIDDQVIFLLSQIPYSEKFDFTERKKIMNGLAQLEKVPEEIINRRKYGFVDAMRIKESKR